MKNIIDKIITDSRIKPTIISNDTDINNDLCGYELEELDNNKIKVLAYDLILFNDNAFRYYIFNFIKYLIDNNNIFSETAFIYVLFPINIKERNNISEYTKDEIYGIIFFLEWCLSKISKYKLSKIDDQYTSLIDYENEILESIFYWKQL